jgi:hypothetical protein
VVGRIPAPGRGLAALAHQRDDVVERMVGREADALEQEIHGAIVAAPSARFVARATMPAMHFPHLRGPLAGLLVLASCACRSMQGGPSSASVEAARRALPAAVAHVPLPASIDVEHYELELAIDESARTIEGLCRLRIWPRRGVERVEEVALDLDGLAVRSVRDGRARELGFEQHEAVLDIRLAEPLLAGAFVELAIEYGGAPQRGLWFNQDAQGRVDQVFTQGECEDARAWFPCLDDPSDRATSQLTVDVPASWSVLAAGRRLERRVQGARARETWRMDTPHPAYLSTLVAGELAQHASQHGALPLVTLAEQRYEPILDAAFAPTGAILDLFGELTGVSYPYPKYGQACVRNFPFGGMENISATTLTELALGDELSLRDAPLDGLIAHEAAHQWFGDLLTCRDWSHVWLNEGLATYMGALWTERSAGAEAYQLAIERAQEASLAADTPERQRPIVWNVYRRPMDLFFTGHVYQGAAVRLHLLRCELGDAAFFRGLALYTGRNRGRAVVTDDLRAAFEDAAGQDLGPFFQQWFESPGHPELRVAWRWDAPRKRVELTVDQLQSTTGGVPAAFQAAVEIEIADARGRRTQRAPAAPAPPARAPRLRARARVGAVRRARRLADGVRRPQAGPRVAGDRSRMRARHVPPRGRCARWPSSRPTRASAPSARSSWRRSSSAQAVTSCPRCAWRPSRRWACCARARRARCCSSARPRTRTRACAARPSTRSGTGARTPRWRASPSTSSRRAGAGTRWRTPRSCARVPCRPRPGSGSAPAAARPRRTAASRPSS